MSTVIVKGNRNETFDRQRVLVKDITKGEEHNKVPTF